MDVDQMTASRELDARIATEVMGWSGPVWFDRRYRDGEDCWNQRQVERKEDCQHTPVAYWRDENGNCLTEVAAWSPSTDIQAAWQVVEQLRQRFSVVSLHGQDEPFGRSDCPVYWSCGVGPEDQTVIGYATAGTAPLAICRAALKAVGYSSPINPSST